MLNIKVSLQAFDTLARLWGIKSHKSVFSLANNVKMQNKTLFIRYFNRCTFLLHIPYNCDCQRQFAEEHRDLLDFAGDLIPVWVRMCSIRRVMPLLA